ncbi:hypothetical protein BJF93_12505 [Xaviernesmea oryzae]|uniref:HepT-like domain-containing protein n=2 Tax=Xaviernesmea oryzae TaxID=464029 RepID=A0A1Q9B3L0_9HYPH|nr:hypothetical protein BJF93_12505 [Xaviernesmea oryzae]
MAHYYEAHSHEVLAGDWGAVSAVAAGIHNVYNGIEDILLSIARDVDDYVPTGGSAHQDILDQMAAAINGRRPALLNLSLYDHLFELKAFRHLVRHKYGFDLKPEKVAANFDLINAIFPEFIDAVVSLEKAMLEEIHDPANESKPGSR